MFVYFISAFSLYIIFILMHISARRYFDFRCRPSFRQPDWHLLMSTAKSASNAAKRQLFKNGRLKMIEYRTYDACKYKFVLRSQLHQKLPKRYIDALLPSLLTI